MKLQSYEEKISMMKGFVSNKFSFKLIKDRIYVNSQPYIQLLNSMVLALTLCRAITSPKSSCWKQKCFREIAPQGMVCNDSNAV